MTAPKGLYRCAKCYKFTPMTYIIAEEEINQETLQEEIVKYGVCLDCLHEHNKDQMQMRDYEYVG